MDSKPVDLNKHKAAITSLIEENMAQTEGRTAYLDRALNGLRSAAGSLTNHELESAELAKAKSSTAATAKPAGSTAK